MIGRSSFSSRRSTVPKQVNVDTPPPPRARAIEVEAPPVAAGLFTRMRAMAGYGTPPVPLATMHAVRDARSRELATSKLADAALIERAKELAKDPLLPRGELSAIFREVAKRTLKKRPFDVQLLAAQELARGKAAEMKTGEGKSLAAALAAAENALAHGGCHLATTTPYLAARDATAFRAFFEKLGLIVAHLHPKMTREEKRVAYKADVLYASAEALAFDYLEDQMVHSLDDKVQRGHVAAIVDEADDILIDASETPLILAGDPVTQSARANMEKYVELGDRIARALDRDRHLELRYERDAIIPLLTDEGMDFLEAKAAELLHADPKTFKFWEIENTELIAAVFAGIRAHYGVQVDEQYIDDGGKLALVNANTGQPQHTTRWRDGLTEAVQQKEGRPIEAPRRTLGQITFQNYFRTYAHLAGMSGTLGSVREELARTYNLDLVEIPARKPNLRADEPDRYFPHPALRDLALFADLVNAHRKGQPVLLATTSVAASKRFSERLANPLLLLEDVAGSSAPLADLYRELGPEEFAELLEERGVPAKCLLEHREGFAHRVLNAEHHAEEAALIAEAGQRGAITVATQMAGRGVDIPLGAGVAHIGGLRVLGAGHQSNRRRDDQLRGRAGRQGDPGSTAFYVSPSDPSFSYLSAFRLRELAEQLGTDRVEQPHSELLWGWEDAVRRAQDRAESSGFAARRANLAFDDAIQSKRRVITEMREDIMRDGDALDILRGWLAEAPGAPKDLRVPDEPALERFMQRALIHLLDQTWSAYLEDLERMRFTAMMRASAQKDPRVEMVFVVSERFDQAIDVFRGNAVAQLLKAMS